MAGNIADAGAGDCRDAPWAIRCLTGRHAGRVFRLPAGHAVAVGAGESCAIRSASSELCPRHCALRVTARGLFVRDLGSRRGTCVNGVPISGWLPLRPGDRVRAGTLEMSVCLARSAPRSIPSPDECEPLELADALRLARSAPRR